MKTEVSSRRSPDVTANAHQEDGIVTITTDAGDNVTEDVECYHLAYNNIYINYIYIYIYIYPISSALDAPVSQARSTMLSTEAVG